MSGIAMGPSPDAGIAKPLDLAEKIQRDQLEAQRYREEVLMLDEQFMRSLADVSAEQPRQSKPGIEHAREYRQAYKNRIRQEIKRLGRPKPRTAESYYQKYLQEKLDSNEDAPL
jgi:hypothetical protein